MSIVREPSVHHLDVLHIEGPLRAPLKGDLGQRVQARLRRGGRRIVLDLGRVSTIDAGGLGELVGAYNLTVAAGGALQIVHATAWVREILQRVGLFDLLSKSESMPLQQTRRRRVCAARTWRNVPCVRPILGRALEAKWTTIWKGCRASS